MAKLVLQAGDDGLDVVEDRFRGYPKGGHALLGKPGVPTSVVATLLFEAVLGAVDFDAELERSAVEVEHVGAERMLAAEVEAVQAAALDPGPQEDFRQGHAVTEARGS